MYLSSDIHYSGYVMSILDYVAKLGPLITILATVGFGYWKYSSRQRNERRKLRLALKAELETIEPVGQYNHQAFKEIFQYGIPIEMYKNSAIHIGNLTEGEMAKITEFYAYAEVLSMTMKVIDESDEKVEVWINKFDNKRKEALEEIEENLSKDASWLKDFRKRF